MGNQTMGEFLAVLRKANGYTQQEVADKLNVSNRTLSSWETDRTTPDILLLPSIAELYGVTVDELIKGGRNAPDDNNTQDSKFSEEALHSARKYRFGKYSLRCLILETCGCAGCSLLVLSQIASLPTWLSIVFLVLGLSGAIACGILLFYFCGNAKLKEKIVLSEDYTDDKRAYAIAVNARCKRFFLICTVPFFVYAEVIIFRTISIITDIPDFNYIIGMDTIFATLLKNIVISVSTILFVIFAFLIAYAIYDKKCVKSMYSEAQSEIYKNNSKLAKKIFICSIIPFGISLIIMLLFVILWVTYTLCSVNEIVFILLWAAAIINLISIVVPILIHIFKRQKQNYDF